MNFDDNTVKELSKRTLKNLQHEEPSEESVEQLYQAMQSAYDDMVVEREKEIQQEISKDDPFLVHFGDRVHTDATGRIIAFGYHGGKGAYMRQLFEQYKKQHPNVYMYTFDPKEVVSAERD